MGTIAKSSCMVTLAGLVALVSGCATEPRPPAYSSPLQFVVVVKGESGPLQTFAKYIDDPLNAETVKDCQKKIPQGPREAVSKSDESGQLAYECAPKGKAASDAQLALFAKAYGNSIQSLLEMKITTASTCVAKRCYGGPLRMWYDSPPCTYPC